MFRDQILMFWRSGQFRLKVQLAISVTNIKEILELATIATVKFLLKYILKHFLVKDCRITFFDKFEIKNFWNYVNPMKINFRNLILKISISRKMSSSKVTVCFTKEIKQKMREIAKTCEIQAKSLVFSLFLSEIENFKIIFWNFIFIGST